MFDNRFVRGAVGVAVVAAIAWIVSGYWSEFRRAAGDADRLTAQPSAEATASPDPAAQPEGEGGSSDQGEAAEVLVVEIDGLNLRTQPSRSSRAVRGLDKGERLVRIGATEGWFEVRTEQGETGWVSSNDSYTSRQ